MGSGLAISQVLWEIETTEVASVRDSTGCLSPAQSIPQSLGLDGARKESMRDILCDMITAALSEQEAAGSP
jgi:hypothetical protein